MDVKGEGDPALPKAESPNGTKYIITQETDEMIDELEKVPEVELAGPIEKQSINIFVGQSGSGKSLTTFCVAWFETKKGNFTHTVYLNLDDPPNTYKDRYMNFERLRNFTYIAKTQFKKRFKHLKGKTLKEKAWSFLEDLANDPLENEDWLIILDNLQKLCDYNNFQELTQFFDLCDRLTDAKYTLLIIHHKSSKFESPNFKGLSLIKDNADVMWEVVPIRNKSGIIRSVKLTKMKARSITSYDNFIISFDTDQGTVSYDQNVLFEDELPIKDAIINFLTTNPNSNQGNIIQAIKPLTSIGEKRIRVVLEKLVGLHELTVTKGLRHTKIYNIASEKSSSQNGNLNTTT